MQTLTYSQPPLDSANQDVTVLMSDEKIGTLSLYFPSKVHELMNQVVPNQWAHLKLETPDGHSLMIVQNSGFIPGRERTWSVLDGSRVAGTIKEELSHQNQVHTLSYSDGELTVMIKKGHIRGTSKKGSFEIAGSESDATIANGETDYIRNGITTAHQVTVRGENEAPLIVAALNYLLRLTDRG
ncbi:hypothetical protein CR205_14405 [Alteribacter lacisalsi]|uniref:Uncharacterized protein n=1 Tax=Alteribacter lacisalsi TaxID=2045244 RepID=A0A2W0H7Z5_9BACI|nr:hypothetical protein [Alteribacter lacisalsi]PYZ96866.1 hypothetical protein CR205_14405 [Alteribacter lacisalsi]